MSRLTDEQIQRLLETGLPLPDTTSAEQVEDIKLYRQLFGELKQELPIQPDSGFAVRVMDRIDVRPAPAPSGSRLWIGVSLGVITCMLILAAFSAFGTGLMSILAPLKPMKWGILFSLCSLLLVQLLDFKLIREPSLRKSFNCG